MISGVLKSHVMLMETISLKTTKIAKNQSRKKQGTANVKMDKRPGKKDVVYKSVMVTATNRVRKHALKKVNES